LTSFLLPRFTVLSDEDNVLINALVTQLEGVQRHNTMVAAYYEGRNLAKDLGIAIPPHLRTVETVVGWPGTVVDVLEERLEHNGWIVPGNGADDLGISEIVEANQLNEEFSKGHLDALIYGIAFGVVGSGEEGEPSTLITVESPTHMTGTWNRRKRALEYALCMTYDEKGKPTGAAFYKPGETIDLAPNGVGWDIEGRDTHNMPGIPVEPIVNRPRAGDMSGRSEITRAIRAYTDNAVRTVLGMEIAREFFSAPQRYMLGVKESAFQDADGNPLSAWESYIGKILALEADEDGTMPQVGSFAASSPEPFVAQLRQLAQLVAAESGMSATYLGIVQDNPASADAIRAADVRLEKRAERRQRIFGAAEGRLMRKALWVRDGKDPGVTPRPIWRDAGTPTRSAQAQDAVALVTAGILPGDSDVTYERIGLSEADRQRIRADLRRARATHMVSALAAAAKAAETEVAGFVGDTGQDE
jgi:hypothetical protein